MQTVITAHVHRSKQVAIFLPVSVMSGPKLFHSVIVQKLLNFYKEVCGMLYV